MVESEGVGRLVDYFPCEATSLDIILFCVAQIGFLVASRSPHT